MNADQPGLQVLSVSRQFIPSRKRRWPLARLPGTYVLNWAEMECGACDAQWRSTPGRRPGDCQQTSDESSIVVSCPNCNDPQKVSLNQGYVELERLLLA